MPQSVMVRGDPASKSARLRFGNCSAMGGAIHLLMWAASAGNQPGTSRLGLTEDTAKAHFHGRGPAEEALADGTDRLREEGSETCSTLALPRESLTLTTSMKELSRMAPGIDLILDCSERGEFRRQ